MNAPITGKIKNVALSGILCMGVMLTIAPTGATQPQFIARASLSPQQPPAVPSKAQVVEVVYQTSPIQKTQADDSVAAVVLSPGLTGSIGRAKCGGNCINEPGLKKQNGNPITWAVTSRTPTIGATALWTYNHTGLVVGLWSNGDVEVRHQNFCGGQTRFPRSAFRGFR